MGSPALILPGFCLFSTEKRSPIVPLTVKHLYLPLLAILLGCQQSEKPQPELEDLFVAPAAAHTVVEPRHIDVPEGFECIAKMEGISLDLRYRTPNNFMQTDLYGDYPGCYLHRDAAAKLKQAVALLQKRRPGWKLRVLDALRPREIQEKMFAKVKGTLKSKYVANPRDGSGHNYGMSVDVTLEDEHGNEIDMGTAFDDFTPLAQPRYEAMHVKNGKLTKAHYDNRLLLRSVMRQAGFNALLQEWWHFNARGIKTIKSRYKIVERIP